MGQVDTMAIVSFLVLLEQCNTRVSPKGREGASPKEPKPRSGDFERYEDMELEHHWDG